MSLLIGGTVLAACLAASQWLAPLIPNETLARVVAESLVIVGWGRELAALGDLSLRLVADPAADQAL